MNRFLFIFCFVFLVCVSFVSADSDFFGVSDVDKVVCDLDVGVSDLTIVDDNNLVFYLSNGEFFDVSIINMSYFHVSGDDISDFVSFSGSDVIVSGFNDSFGIKLSNSLFLDGVINSTGFVVVSSVLCDDVFIPFNVVITDDFDSNIFFFNSVNSFFNRGFSSNLVGFKLIYVFIFLIVCFSILFYSAKSDLSLGYYFYYFFKVLFFSLLSLFVLIFVVRLLL